MESSDQGQSWCLERLPPRLDARRLRPPACSRGFDVFTYRAEAPRPAVSTRVAVSHGQLGSARYVVARLNSCNQSSAAMNIKNSLTNVDQYLIAHRELKASEDRLSRELLSLPYEHSARPATSESLDKVRSDLATLESQCAIESRDFDVFVSSRDWKLIEFLRNNPQPSRPTCHHTEQEIRRRFFVDGTQHIRLQCMACGSEIKDLRKNDFPNWQQLPVFDDSLSALFYVEYESWQKKYQELHNSLPALEGVPEFDDVGFRAAYVADNPKPLSVGNCEHPRLRLTRRLKSGLAIVEQCEFCGAYIRAKSKKQIPNIDDLPLFDEHLEKALTQKADAWSDEYITAWKAARSEFRLRRDLDWMQGKLQITDHTTFGQYYDSPQWLNTRDRILKRDRYSCQSCIKTAQCVHHLCYERLGRENDSDLISLCNACHTLVHKIQNSYGYAFKLTSGEIRELGSVDEYVD